MNAQTLVFESKSWWKSEWEVLRNSQHVGTFSITRPMTYAEAVATAAGLQWKLSSSPWSWTYTIVVKDDTGKAVAETKQIGSWWKPRYQIELGGKKYTINALSWSGMRYSVTDEQNQNILALQMGWFGVSSTIDMQNSDIDDTTLLLISFIAFYQTKIIEMQSAAAGSGVVAVA